VAEKRHVNTLNNLAERVRELEGGVESLSGQRRSLQEDNNGLRSQIADLNSQLVQEKGNNMDLSNELDSLNKKLKVTQTSVELLQSMQDQRDAVLRDLEKVRNNNDNFAKQINALERDLLAKSRDFEAIERRNKDELFKSVARVQNLEAALNGFKTDNSKLKKENIELRNHIITLEQLLCVKEDVYAQLQASNERLENKTDETDKLRGELAASSKVHES
jgi:chromosome segregation ATPase